MEDRKARPKSLVMLVVWVSVMAIIAFVHAVHRFGLGMRGWNTNGREDKHAIPIKARREEIDLFNLQGVII